ncbi:hypothetical protein [Haematospirillum jordaniae]|uniref:hypothetical protein n=1 Tax=Haematospirillum jordaniae TaxID=1549855 RepID=UPI001433469C|nr:hypothetical protein [Haematospirillum jordaniae]
MRISINIPPKVPTVPWVLVIALWLMMGLLVKDVVTGGVSVYLQRPLWSQIATGLAMGAAIINAMVYGLFALTDLRALRRMREELIVAVLAAVGDGREGAGQGKRGRRSASTKAGPKKVRRFLSRQSVGQSVGQRRFSFFRAL